MTDMFAMKPKQDRNKTFGNSSSRVACHNALSIKMLQISGMRAGTGHFVPRRGFPVTPGGRPNRTLARVRYIPRLTPLRFIRRLTRAPKWPPK